MARRVLGAFAVTATATLASLALATPASAHTPTVKVDCDETAQKSVLTVELKDYNTRKGQNTLKVEIDGKEVAQTSFGNNLPATKWETNSTADHTYKVTVLASDDPDLENTNPHWSRVFKLDNKKCVKTPPKPEQPKPEQPKPEEPKPEQPPVVTTTEAPSSSVTPPAPGGSTPEPPLAATGASPLWLLLSGLGLVGAGAGTLLFLRRRRSA